MSRSTSHELLAFYRGEGTDRAGRTFADVQGLSDAQLESTHDYIQWLFPLFTASAFAPEAPTLDQEALHAFRSDALLQSKVIGVLRRMLEFYGLELDDTEPTDIVIDVGTRFPERRRNWLTPDNHNYRRITRILTSLQLLGLGAYARALLDCLVVLYREHAGRIGPKAYSRWTAAVGRQ